MKENPDYILQYIVFGNQRFFNEALFSIASAWRFIKKSNYKIKIVIYTDNESFFKNLPVQTIHLDNNIWNDWTGKDNYTYRSKIICIKDCIERFNVQTIFIDTDTIFINNPDNIYEKIVEGYNFMHFNEGLPNKKLMSFINDNKIKNWIDQELTIKPTYNIWNSGVVAINKNNSKFIYKIIEFNDLYFNVSKYFATEQFAFSVILDDNNTLLPANDIIFHYWHAVLKKDFQKKFNLMISELGKDNLDKWADNLDKYWPIWPIKEKPGIRLRVLLYKSGLFPKFKSLSALFITKPDL